MSNLEKLHIRFLKAFEVANSMDNIDIPIDLRLQFYAYYKQASTDTIGFYSTNDPDSMRNAFKMNAILQVQNLNPEEAKEAYINLVNETITKYKVKVDFV